MPEEKSSAESFPKKKLPIKTLKHRSKGDQNGTRDFEETHLFPCKNCERRFTTKQGLERHQHIHISTEGFTFKCKYCSKAFGTHINMRRHERRHEAAPKKKNILKGSPTLQITNEDFDFDQRAIDISVNTSMRLQSPMPLEECKKSVAKESHLEPSSTRGCESKLQHPCRLCKKTFGSYTNLRRHQRRIHERPLLAKGIRVRRKPLGEESNLVMEQSLGSAGARTTHMEMEEEEEVEEEEEESDESQAFIMDVSSNISENLNFYIDGKIESNSNTSNCEVIELDTTCTNPYGLASVLYAVTDESPQNLKITAQVPAGHLHLKELSDGELKGPKRRRTISPPPFAKAKPDLGVETISSTVSSLCSLTLPAHTTNSLTGHQEKNTFLTSKLKQLLQIQDGNAPRALPGESSAIVTPSTSTGAAMGFSRFKRRTSSPPNSPQHSPALSGTGKDAEFIRLWSESLPGLKVPKNESQNSSPAWSLSSREEALSPLSVDNPGKITVSSKEGQPSQLVINLCSQQPLDLSNSKVQSDVKTESGGSGVAILDLSLHKKPYGEGEVKEEVAIAGPYAACSNKKRKPTTSMLEKVLLNEYNGTDLSVAGRQEPEESPKPCHGAEESLQDMSEPAPAEPVTVSPVPSPQPPILSVPSPLPQSTTSVLQPVTPALSPVSVHIKEEVRDSDYPDSDSEQEAGQALPPTIEPEIPQEMSDEYCPGEEEEESEGDCQPVEDQDKMELAFTKNFACNVCEMPFLSIKDLAQHLHVHAEHWPFKCEFCVQLFKEADCLSEHRSSLHGVGKIFACSVCNKEFAFLCNLQHHQRDLHPGKECTHQELQNGMLRPQNFTDPDKATSCPSQSTARPASSTPPPPEEDDDNSTDLTEELYTTIKVMASGVKSKGPDVRMGLNQRYPSFKPPPFQYHNRSAPSVGSSAVNFTTHNIPQTFSTAIHCTKCGKSFDNMPALHKHILACASASDKRRYTPKKNVIPLKKKVWKKNGVLGSEPARNNMMRRMGQPKRLSFDTDSKPKATINKLKMNALKRKRNRLVQKAIAQKKRASAKEKAMLNARGMESHHCPYCVKEFTYLGSLNKHVTYSCPKKPVSPSAKGSGLHSPASSEKGTVQRRRTADTEIKLQNTPILLGKRRGRMLGTLQTESVSSAPRLQQRMRSLPPIKSKKPNTSPITSRTTSPVRSAKGTVAESKRFKSDSRQRAPTASTGMASPRLYLRMKNKKVVWQRRANVLKQKRPERYSGRNKETRSGAITRSGGPANTDSEMEDDQENQGSSSEDVQVSMMKMSR